MLDVSRRNNPTRIQCSQTLVWCEKPGFLSQTPRFKPYLSLQVTCSWASYSNYPSLSFFIHVKWVYS